MSQELITSVSFNQSGLRFPYNDALADLGIDNIGWKVLQDVIFPNATSADSIIMALTYCRRRKLDIFKRPVHIVPMYSTAANGGKGAMIDTVWPSIAEIRTTAFRTGEYAGRDPTAFGPEITEDLGGVRVAFPAWAQITVYRIVQGARCPFPGPRVYWLETYAHAKRESDAPNAIWRKRPNGQIEKCAEGGALRGAFPEEIGGEYSAEEMDGQQFITQTPEYGPPSEPPPPEIEHKPQVAMDTGAFPADKTPILNPLPHGAHSVEYRLDNNAGVVIASGNLPPEPAKRKRATKAEMEARRAAEGKGATSHELDKALKILMPPVETAMDQIKEGVEANLPPDDDIPMPPDELKYNTVDNCYGSVKEMMDAAWAPQHGDPFGYPPEDPPPPVNDNVPSHIQSAVAKWKTVIRSAESEAELDSAWDTHISAAQAQMPTWLYEECINLDDERRGEI